MGGCLQGRRQKNFQVRTNGKTEKYSGGLGGAMVYPRAHLKGTLHQELRVKVEDLFYRNAHFRKNAYFFKKILGTSCAKKLVLGPQPLLLNVNQCNECLLQNTFRDIMYENPWG